MDVPSIFAHLVPSPATAVVVDYQKWNALGSAALLTLLGIVVGIVALVRWVLSWF